MGDLGPTLLSILGHDLMGKRVLIGLVFVFAIMSGAAREFLFVNLNYSIDHLANHRQINYAHSAFRAATDGISLQGLTNIKWGLAIGFVLLMLLLSIVLSKALHGDHRYMRMLILGFAGIGALALVLQLASAFHPAFDGLSVKLLHMIQYPVVLLFLWAAAMLKPSTV